MTKRLIDRFKEFIGKKIEITYVGDSGRASFEGKLVDFNRDYWEIIDKYGYPIIVLLNDNILRIRLKEQVFKQEGQV